MPTVPNQPASWQILNNPISALDNWPYWNIGGDLLAVAYLPAGPVTSRVRAVRGSNGLCD